MAMTDPREIQSRFEFLKQQRTSWEGMWRDIRDYILPDFGAFDGEDPTDGQKRFKRIINAEATNAADILAAGLLSGVSSPSRPWLRLTTLDGELDQSPEVKQWLDEVQRTMMLIFAKADVYNQLHQSYLELPVFGQACTIARPHPDRIINLQNLTIGEYWISEDQYGSVDTLYRKMSMTAKQMIQTWGLDKVSEEVRSAYRSNPYQRFNVIHAIEPRWERDDMKRDAINKPWKSIYFEENAITKGHVLSESGFDDFPAMCPRWMTSGGSAYGRGCGAKALGAARNLQRLETRVATMVDYLSDPPMMYPDSMVGNLDLFRPSGRIPVSAGEEALIRPAIQMTTDPSPVEMMIAKREAQIQRFFYVNIFQMLASTMGDQRTATEVAALEQEKVMMLGPVLERLHSELLDPLVTSTFNFMVEQNKVPPIPDELQGKSLNVEYISVLAEAQKTASATGIIKLSQEIGLLAQINPSVLDKLDVDKAVDELADLNGVSPSLIVAGERVALIRKARQQQQMQQQKIADTQAMASAMRDLAPAADSKGLQEALESMPAGM